MTESTLEQDLVQEESKLRKRNTGGPRPFPQNTIEESLVIPIALKEKNGGNPWIPEEVGNAIGMKAGGNKFYYLSASARDYGLTIGTRETEKISLTDVGRQIVYAKSEIEKKTGYKKAFEKISIFKKVFDYYKDNSLPEMEYLKNTLITEFNLKEAYHEDFVKIYKANL